ncbi:MAG: filamentous hemagglutinin N-terminal domain-containing protein, partial [Sulfurospirillaceae bacterium]
MKKLIKSIIIVQVVFAQMLFAKDLVVDVSAPKSNQPNLKEARNGVPVVDIVKPNNKGLSHNKFTNYNVNKEGLILNNSNKSTVSTHLGGYIFGNPNLAGTTAKTILNEVTSKNQTHLKGFTEVAGDRASVVVANPNGIYINGAGFINTHSAILAAGVPNVMDGEVANYMIRGGEIEVDGSGLNTTNVDRVKLYAKAIKLNAQIHAKDLEMIAGDSETWVDDENRVLFGIDSTALGGIYANKITLIGTEDGVGVNLPVEISSLDNLKISADGKIVLDRAVSSKDVDIKSFSDSVDLNTLYGDNINIEAKSLTNKKIIAAQKKIDIEAEDVTNNSAIVTLNEDITITADTLTNYNTIYSNDSVNLYIKDKLLNETNNDMVDLANEKAIIFAKNDMNIQGDKDKINKTEEIVNKSADIQTKDGNIDIYANILTNKRALDYTNDAFVATSKVTDSIYFQEGKSYPSSGENGIINYFYITRGQDIHVYANNSEFYLVSDLAREPFSYHYVTTEVTMDKKVFYDNPRYKASVISSGKDLNLNITTIENQISNISAVRDIYFNSDQIINYHNTIHATNISFKTYHTKNGIKSAQNGTLRRGNTVLKSTGGDVWGDYDYGTYIANQNVEMGGVIVAGRDIKGTANSVINGTILDNQTIAPTITESKLDTIYASLELPTNKYGLFVAVDPDRNLDYLIESNPLYTNYDNYVGSSYFLE